MLRGEGGSVFAYHLGFDREAGRAAPVYLRLLHAGVAEAIAMGGRRVLLGAPRSKPKPRSEPKASGWRSTLATAVR